MPEGICCLYFAPQGQPKPIYLYLYIQEYRKGDLVVFTGELLEGVHWLVRGRMHVADAAMWPEVPRLHMRLCVSLCVSVCLSVSLSLSLSLCVRAYESERGRVSECVSECTYVCARVHACMSTLVRQVCA